MHVVFDLDGVLIDTEDVVARCYTAAGATPPRPILTHEDSSWLVDQVGEEQAPVVWRRKNQVYINSIRSGAAPFMQGAFAARRLAHEGHRVHIMTGAPSGTIAALRELWVDRLHGGWPFGLTFDGMKTPAKMKAIRLINERTSGLVGAYVDDQDKFIDLPANWRFVHFNDHEDTVDRLTARILREEDIT